MKGPKSPNQLFGGVQKGISNLSFLSQKHDHLDEFFQPPKEVSRDYESRTIKDPRAFLRKKKSGHTRITFNTFFA